MARNIGALVSQVKYTRSKPVTKGTLVHLVSEGKMTVERAQEIARDRGQELSNAQIGKVLIDGLMQARDLRAYIDTHPQVLKFLSGRR